MNSEAKRGRVAGLLVGSAAVLAFLWSPQAGAQDALTQAPAAQTPSLDAAAQAAPAPAPAAAQAPSFAPSGATIGGSNSAIGAIAGSGPAVATNTAAVGAGPSATALLGSAQSQQFGNNTTVVNQNANARSGDAVAGSQVVGVVGGGPTTVLGSNNCIGCVAASGPAVAVNAVAAGAGPSATAVLGSANTQQFGNNTTVVNQTSDARSGDAVAGSQVTGIVGGFGSTVLNQNSCFGCLALSGPAIAPNFALVRSGPSAFGLLGFSNASQVGNNDAILSQRSISRSGDALAGSQTTGLVGGGNILGSNFGFLPFAASGLATGGNVALGGAGPQAGPAGIGIASTSQTGNNNAVADQLSDIRSGDGVAGSQVNGVVAQEAGVLGTRNARAPNPLGVASVG